MKRRWLAGLLLASFALGACGKEETPVETPKPVAENTEFVTPGGKLEHTEGIAISWEGRSAHVGDSAENALKLFAEPRSAYLLRSLPARFGPSFEAHGWETNDGRGYGIITYKDQVVAAVFHLEGAEKDYAENILNAQRNGTGTLKMNEVSSGDSHWSFWESGEQRLMVLIAKGKKGSDVTVLMGDNKILDALGATKPASPLPPTIATPAGPLFNLPSGQ